jgi:hypothetical protein
MRRVATAGPPCCSGRRRRHRFAAEHPACPHIGGCGSLGPGAASNSLGGLEIVARFGARIRRKRSLTVCSYPGVLPTGCWMRASRKNTRTAPLISAESLLGHADSDQLRPRPRQPFPTRPAKRVQPIQALLRLSLVLAPKTTTPRFSGGPGAHHGHPRGGHPQ